MPKYIVKTSQRPYAQVISTHNSLPMAWKSLKAYHSRRFRGHAYKSAIQGVAIIAAIPPDLPGLPRRRQHTGHTIAQPETQKAHRARLAAHANAHTQQAERDLFDLRLSLGLGPISNKSIPLVIHQWIPNLHTYLAIGVPDERPKEPPKKIKRIHTKRAEYWKTGISQAERDEEREMKLEKIRARRQDKESTPTQ